MAKRASLSTASRQTVKSQFQRLNKGMFNHQKESHHQEGNKPRMLLVDKALREQVQEDLLSDQRDIIPVQ